MEIDENITGIDWLAQQGRYLKIATTNSRSIKLWKIFEKTDKKVAKQAGKELNMPNLQTTDSYLAAKVQQTLPCKHHTSINSINSSQNQEYLLSSDDLHCLLWSYERPDKPYQIGDMMGNKKSEEVE